MTTPTSTSEPNRLLDEPGEASSLERALLRAGSSYRTSPHSRAKVLAGLGLAAGSTTLLTGTAAAASSAATLTWTKLLLGVSIFGAVAAVPVGYYALRHPTAPVSRPAASLPMVSEPATAPAAQGQQDTQAVAPAAATRAAALLTEELGALDHARLSLANGDARRALEELEAYDRRYPQGRLQIEAEVLRIDALAKVGHKDVARQRAEAFLRHHPNSVLATRVRAHLAD
jgi:hypothetical protein